MSSRFEDDGGGQPVVGVDLDDAEHLSGDLTRCRAARRGTNANECKTLLAGRYDGRRKALESDLGHRSHVRDMGSATAQDIGVDNPTAIVCAAVIGDYLGHRSPLVVREVLPKTLGHLARRVFQSPCLRLQFLKSGERRIEV